VFASDQPLDRLAKREVRQTGTDRSILNEEAGEGQAALEIFSLIAKLPR
jgi:hypothetical protein